MTNFPNTIFKYCRDAHRVLRLYQVQKIPRFLWVNFTKMYDQAGTRYKRDIGYTEIIN